MTTKHRGQPLHTHTTEMKKAGPGPSVFHDLAHAHEWEGQPLAYHLADHAAARGALGPTDAGLRAGLPGAVARAPGHHLMPNPKAGSAVRQGHGPASDDPAAGRGLPPHR